MTIAPILATALLQLAPPPPQVTLIQLPAEQSGARAATETLLAKLQPAYVLVRPSPHPTGPFQLCWTRQPATESCLARALGEAGAEPGEVVLAPWEKDGVLHWLCVGRNETWFAASQQSVALGPIADLYRDGESELLHRAAACLTFAGRQSGW